MQPDGLVITLRRAKTDQAGAGRRLGLPYGRDAATCPVRAVQDWLTVSGIAATCPVRAVQDWLTVSGIAAGPLFRGVDKDDRIAPTRLSDRTVARVVKRAAAAAGLDPARYAGHSLRAGLATSAAAAGTSERVIMAQTGHKSLPMVRKYIRDGSLFAQNAAADAGL